MAQKYIMGDLVKVILDNEEQVVKVIGYDPTYKRYLLTNKYIDETRGYISFAEDKINPICPTRKILEKNGWSKGQIYFRHSRIPRIKLCTDGGISWSVSINDDIMGSYINYVHQLQHILFAFGIEEEMEV